MLVRLLRYRPIDASIRTKFSGEPSGQGFRDFFHVYCGFLILSPRSQASSPYEIFFTIGSFLAIWAPAASLNGVHQIKRSLGIQESWIAERAVRKQPRESSELALH